MRKGAKTVRIALSVTVSGGMMKIPGYIAIGDHRTAYHRQRNEAKQGKLIARRGLAIHHLYRYEAKAHDRLDQTQRRDLWHSCSPDQERRGDS